MLLQDGAGGAANATADGFFAEALVSLVTVAAGEAVVLALDFQNVDGFAESFGLNGFHQGRNFCGVCLSR